MNNLVGVVVGLAAEARIARHLGLVVAIGGGTPAGAERAARQLIDHGASGLISFGLAGGLDPALRPGDLVVPSAVIVETLHVATDRQLSQQLGGTTQHELLAATAIVADAGDKRRLWDATGACAVDLESGAVARLATAHELPFAVLRAICDPAQRTLPAAALVALDQHGMVGLTRVLASLASDPRQIGALLALAADAAKAKQALRKRIKSISQA